MRRLLIPLLTALLTVVALFASFSVTHAQEPDVSAPEGGIPHVQDWSCVQPNPAQDACFINFRQLTFNTGSDVTVGLEVTVAISGTPNNLHPIVASYLGAESEGALFITGATNGLGFQVACGEAATPGSRYGNTYRVGISGYRSNLACPAYVPQVPPTAVGVNTFSATLDRLAPYQGYLVALVVGVGLLVNLLVPARLKQWRKRTE